MKTNKQEFKFIELDKQEINDWIKKNELEQIKGILKIAQRYDYFPPCGKPYGWTVDSEIKEIGKAIDEILMNHKDYNPGDAGVSHYYVKGEILFMCYILFQEKRSPQHMICIGINENRNYRIYQAY